jgi:predicted DNA-binding protein
VTPTKQVEGRGSVGAHPSVLHLCYAKAMKSSTSSFRIPEDLRIRLERTARHMGRGKNWLINRALEEYLNKVGREALAAEARRQSLAASGVTTKDEEFWQKQADTTSWS